MDSDALPVPLTTGYEPRMARVHQRDAQPVKSLSLFTPGRARRVPLGTRGRPTELNPCSACRAGSHSCKEHARRTGTLRMVPERDAAVPPVRARERMNGRGDSSGLGHGVGAAWAGTLAAACCGKACEAAEGQHGLITRDASGLILPFGFGSAGGNLEGTETTRVEEMGERRYGGPEGETRHDELRRAWFDGWTEGVMWTWGKTRQALRQDGQPESVECSVIHHVSSELRSSDGRRPTTR